MTQHILAKHGFTPEQYTDALEHTACYLELYEHFLPEMPYGTAKGRTGDPMVWIHARLEREFFALP